MEPQNAVEIRPPAQPYRLITFYEDGRMTIIPFANENEMNKVAAMAGHRQALAVTVDYLVNSGDEGSIKYGDQPPKRAPRRRSR